MKKVFLFLALAAVSMVASAQSMSFLYNGTTYNNGDTLVFATDEDFMAVLQPNIVNNTQNTIIAKGAIQELTNTGVHTTLCVAGACTDDTESAPFTIDPGQTYTEFVVDFMFDTPLSGYYKLSAINTEDASDKTEIVIALQCTAGINSVANNCTINAYPNPAEGHVSVNYSIENSSNASIVVCNLLGSVVSEIAVEGQQGTAMLDLSNLPAGVYTYGMKVNGNMQSMKKLIVR